VWEERAKGKHRTEVTEATEGSEAGRGTGRGDTRASVREERAMGKHRTEATETTEDTEAGRGTGRRDTRTSVQQERERENTARSSQRVRRPEELTYRAIKSRRGEPYPRRDSTRQTLRSNKRLASEILVEKIESTLPGQLGCRLVVPWRGVVMETVIDAFINVRGVGHMICL
jgi:hypothetical protein